MTETLFIAKKEEKSTFDTESLINLFKSTQDLDIIRNAVEKADDRVFVAWSSVDAVDKSGEKILIEDLIKDMENYMQMPAINDEHTNGVVGKCLAYKVLLHPVTKSLGVLQLNQILKRNKRDDQVWKDLQTGKKTGLSVGGIINKMPKYESNTDGSFVKVLAGFQQYETSVVENPCNQHALNEAVSAVAKSEKMEKEVKKQDESNMEEQSTSEIKIEDVVQMIQALVTRLDEIEAAVSGKPETEEEEKAEDVEEKPAEEEAPMEEKKPEEEKSNHEEVSKVAELESKIETLTKSYSELEKNYSELKKKTEVKEVIKAQRPTSETVDKVLTPYQKMVEKRNSVAKRFQ